MRVPWILVLGSAGCAGAIDADAGRETGPTGTAAVCQQGAVPAPTRVRRLTKVELKAAAAVLLDGQLDQALDELEADPRVADRYSNSERLLASPSFLSSLERAADGVAAHFVATFDRTLYDSACFTSDAAAEPCARAFIRTFGQRAYRRALTDDDVAALMPVYAAGRELGNDNDAGDRFISGLSWLVRAMVQAPDFLYRTELGELSAANGATTRLLSHEIASAVAFSVVGMPPDEALVAAAAEERLATPEQRKEQAARLIATYPEGWKRQMRHFVTEWLGIDFSNPEWAKDVATAPLFSAALKSALETETALVIDDWATETGGARLDLLLTSPSSFVNELTAPLYGVTAAGPTFQKTSLDAGRRAGILTLGGFLGSSSHSGETSPVLRGTVIMKRLLCGVPPPVPANVPPLPSPGASPATTTRARYEAHLANPACSGCHALFEPMGNAFEAYDVLGAYRTEQNGYPVDTTGALVALDGTVTPVEGAVELVNELARSAEVRACVARQVFRFTTGRDEAASDACVLEDATRTLETGSGSLRDVVATIVGSETFVTRQVNR